MADTVPDRPALAEGALGLLRRRMTQLGSAQVAPHFSQHLLFQAMHRWVPLLCHPAIPCKLP